MALTPEVVVNKKFQVTKFREGYDQDEVDDFLDEIVEELRRLNQENDDLRRQVAELEAQTGEAASVPSPVPADGNEADTATAADLPVVETEPEPQAVAEPEPEVVQPAAPGEPTAPVQEASNAHTAESAAGVLAMAQRLHDEYVAEGEKKRDEIISAAEREANRLVTEAQETSRKTLEDFEKRKTVLEREVEELRGFERDYRSRLRSFIENQLKDLDSQARVTE